MASSLVRARSALNHLISSHTPVTCLEDFLLDKSDKKECIEELKLAMHYLYRVGEDTYRFLNHTPYNGDHKDIIKEFICLIKRLQFYRIDYEYKTEEGPMEIMDKLIVEFLVKFRDELMAIVDAQKVCAKCKRNMYIYGAPCLFWDTYGA